MKGQDDIRLARDVLGETLHGPVPMRTVARLAEAVRRLSEEREAALEALQAAECALTQWAQREGRKYVDSTWGEQDPNGTNAALAAVRAVLKGGAR